MEQKVIERKSLSKKLEWFFTGYSMNRAEKILYFVKRLIWLSFLWGAVRAVIQMVAGLIAGDGLTALSLLLPAAVCAAAAVLFFQFD